MGEVWNSLWENCKNIDSVSIMNNPSGISLRSEFAGLLMKYFDLKDKSILEIGTGTGQDCIELALRGANCIGIDKSPESVNLAKRIASDYQINNCIFEEKDIYDLDKSNFDIVFNMGVLEHFDDSEIVKMLKKMSELGKYVIVGIPYSDSDIYKLSKLYSQQKKTWEYEIERDFRSFKKYFEKAGISLLHEQVIGLVNEAYYLRRVNPELISLQLSRNLSKLFDGNDNIGCWLIAIGSVESKLEKKIPKDCVSIITTVYNKEKYIEDSVENLRTLDYPNLEIIYINDGSTDNTKMLLQKKLYKLSNFKLINLKYNLGEYKARYEGLRNASNEYIFFFNIDDLISPEYISNMMRDLKNCPENTHLSSSCALMKDGKFTGGIWYNRYLKSIYDYIISELLTLSGKISLNNTVIKKSNLLKAYDKLDMLYKKMGVERMDVASDTLLLDIMVFSGIIKHVIPIYYAYQGYEQSETSASQQTENRIDGIPFQIAYCFTKINKLFKVDEKELENKIICQAIKIYGVSRGTEFINNFRKYKERLEKVTSKK
jgi:glycosyltransferase involved in cell wall biosynthesis/SAM-dependent methyltransferase